MSIVDFDTCTWSDPWYMGLTPSGKLLFVYLWTNNKKTLSGIYSLSMKTIAFDTGLNTKQVTNTLSILYPKVIYDFDKEIVFVTNHVKRQFLRSGKISPKIVTGISTSLHLLPQGHEFVGLFLEKYPDLNVEYLYPIDTLSVGYAYPPSEGEGEGEGKGSIKYNDDFEQFWERYPRKINKKKAYDAWNKFNSDRPPIEDILKSVDAHKKSNQWAVNKYIPHPTTWLNGHGWLNEVDDLEEIPF